MFNAMQRILQLLFGEKAFVAGLMIIVTAAFVIRVVPLYSDVIQPDSVRFQGIDAFYHVRLTKYAVEHYPNRLEIDPLRKHPGGQVVDVYPAFDFVTASAAVAAGLGDPSERTVELTLAFIPPIFGALGVLFIGLAGMHLGGRAGGLAAASLVAVLPGGTLTQTFLGFSDHHALETLLLSICWYLLIRLFAEPKSFREELPLWILLGTTSGAYILTWEGSPILPAVIIAGTGLRLILRTSSKEHLLHLALRLLVVTGCVWIVLLAVGHSSPMVRVSALLFLLLPILPAVLWGIMRLLPTARPAFRVFVWGFLLTALAVIAYTLLPEKAQTTLLINLGRLRPSATAQTVGEMRPLINDPGLLWQFMGPALYWAAIGMVLAVAGQWRRISHHGLLAISIGLLFIPAALFQVRFSSAASLALALLSAVFFGWILQAQEKSMFSALLRSNTVRGVFLTLWVLTVPIWSVSEAFEKSIIDRGPSVDWTEAMEWFRQNTTDPLEVDRDGTSQRYGILNWWDSGYYVVTMAGRTPVSNPSQAGARAAATWFLDTLGNGTIDDLRKESIRYIVTDAQLALIPNTMYGIQGKYQVLPIWAGKAEREYVRRVYFPMPDGSYDPRFAYTPSYFKGLHVRLLLYGGAKVSPTAENIWAIQTQMIQHPSAGMVESVISAQSFASYDLAATFMARRNDASWSLASFSPFDTCVPLEELQGVTEVFRSPTEALSLPSLPGPVPVVRIFEITP